MKFDTFFFLSQILSGRVQGFATLSVRCIADELRHFRTTRCIFADKSSRGTIPDSHHHTDRIAARTKTSNRIRHIESLSSRQSNHPIFVPQNSVDTGKR